jgi:hypothetical protein
VGGDGDVERGISERVSSGIEAFDVLGDVGSLARPTMTT